MSSVVLLPRLGNTVESCILMSWKVREGDSVAEGTPLCEIETDKAVMEIPAEVAGIVLKILRAEGDDVPVLEPIAVIGNQGEDWGAILAARQATAGTVSAPPAGAASMPPAAAGGEIGLAQPAPDSPSDAASSPAAPLWDASSRSQGARETAAESARKESAASPRARLRAAAEGLDAKTLEGSGPAGRVIERDVLAALDGRPGFTAAAKAALVQGAAAPRTLGGALGGRISLADLSTRGPAGTVSGPGTFAASETDNETVLHSGPEESAAPYTDSQLRGIRKIIAERMTASLRSSAQLSFTASAPAERLLALRGRLKESGPSLGLEGVTVGDLLLFAVSRLLKKHPKLNAHLDGSRLRLWRAVNLGLAVDTPRGLMVPVIRDADSLSLGRLSAEAKRLARACVDARIGPDELAGGTFTVSNLGAFGIESFTPVLNSPETGILGVNAIEARPLPGPDGATLFERRIGFSLTVDHQVVDGADAARFLQDLAALVGDIDIAIAQ